jgi:hypothetical protein
LGVGVFVGVGEGCGLESFPVSDIAGFAAESDRRRGGVEVVQSR